MTFEKEMTNLSPAQLNYLSQLYADRIVEDMEIKYNWKCDLIDDFELHDVAFERIVERLRFFEQEELFSMISGSYGEETLIHFVNKTKSIIKNDNYHVWSRKDGFPLILEK